MVHKSPLASPSGRLLGLRIAAAVGGGLLYLQGLHPYLPGVETGLPAGLAGAALLAGASYAIVADLGLRGDHRRPNAEVLAVVGLFTFLVASVAAARPTEAGTLPPGAVPAVAAGSLLLLLAGVAYLARPSLFRDPP